VLCEDVVDNQNIYDTIVAPYKHGDCNGERSKILFGIVKETSLIESHNSHCFLWVYILLVPYPKQVPDRVLGSRL
jgi:hypothetical protein